MVKKKKFNFDEVSGNIVDQGSKKQNILGVRRSLRNSHFKGIFKVTELKKKGIFIKFKAVRKARARKIGVRKVVMLPSGEFKFEVSKIKRKKR